MTCDRRPLAGRSRAVRIRLFFREPGSVFWTFGFPLLITVALGIAFRNQGPRQEPGRGRGRRRQRGDRAATLGRARARRPGRRRRPRPRAGCARARSCWPSKRPPRRRAQPVVYRYDPSRPDALAARRLVDDTLQRHAGRRDPVADPRRDRGRARRALRRLAGPGAARHAAPQRRDVGGRLQHRQRAPAQAAQAPGRDAHAPRPLPALVPGVGAAVRAAAGAGAVRVRPPRLRRRSSRARSSRRWRSRCSARGRSPASACCARRAPRTARPPTGSSTWSRCR